MSEPIRQNVILLSRTLCWKLENFMNYTSKHTQKTTVLVENKLYYFYNPPCSHILSRSHHNVNKCTQLEIIELSNVRGVGREWRDNLVQPPHFAEDETNTQREDFPKVTQVVENRNETQTMCMFMILCIKTNKYIFNQELKHIWIHFPNEKTTITSKHKWPYSSCLNIPVPFCTALLLVNSQDTSLPLPLNSAHQWAIPKCICYDVCKGSHSEKRSVSVSSVSKYASLKKNQTL